MTDARGIDAWVGALMQGHERALIRYASRILGDPERARDAVQETFWRLSRQPRDAVEPKLPSWLFRVCRNHALDLVKKEARMTPFTDATEAETTARDATPTPEDLAVRRESVDATLGALYGLPPDQREVLCLKFQAGLSYREISEVTAHTTSYVGFLIHHGLRALRERLGARSAEETRS